MPNQSINQSINHYSPGTGLALIDVMDDIEEGGRNAGWPWTLGSAARSGRPGVGPCMWRALGEGPRLIDRPGGIPEYMPPLPMLTDTGPLQTAYLPHLLTIFCFIQIQTSGLRDLCFINRLSFYCMQTPKVSFSPPLPPPTFFFHTVFIRTMRRKTTT